uniref:Uncharacterized protein n=1 Tax=Mycena chlorophos TaxID=658473 RepID=A0ABQ0L5G6_MYCCL|nr:predicted protein [Mycena chlorophos]
MFSRTNHDIFLVLPLHFPEPSVPRRRDRICNTAVTRPVTWSLRTRANASAGSALGQPDSEMEDDVRVVTQFLVNTARCPHSATTPLPQQPSVTLLPRVRSRAPATRTHALAGQQGCAMRTAFAPRLLSVRVYDCSAVPSAHADTLPPPTNPRFTLLVHSRPPTTYSRSKKAHHVTCHKPAIFVLDIAQRALPLRL